MKRLLSALILLSFLAVPALVLAQPPEYPETVETPQDLIDLIKTVGRWFFAGVLAIAVVFLVMSGFYFVTASGDPTKVDKARQMLINSLIGVAVAVAAYGLVQVITGILT